MHGNEDQGAVMLRFSLTRDDVLDALAAQYRVSTRPWYLRWWFLGLLVAVGLVGFVALLGPVSDGRSSAATLALPLLPIAIAVVYANPRLLFRNVARQLMRSNPAFSSPTTVTVSPAAIIASNAVGETRVSWTQYPYYTETESQFLLFSSDRFGGLMQVLPKQGLPYFDPEPLRALLAAHSQPLRLSG